MNKRLVTLIALPVCFFAGATVAQQFPLLDMMAGKVVEKYQSSTCEQLWAARGKPKSEQEQKLVAMLRNNQAARAEFLNRVAGPVANKMFECGMIP